jgi:1-deoxy-D-xylulose-5-phosphate synthase
MFEELGFNYIGPIDGHDLEELVTHLSKIKKLSGSQFLHVVTKKGQGYKLAEHNPIEYHGVTKFNPMVGMSLAKSASSALSYTQVFGKWLCDLAKVETNFVAITPAMREGSGLTTFATLYPDKYFDVGIAEQHSLTFAAGVATGGVKAIVAIYSTFLQRGYDQLIHDIALQELPVMLVIDRAGIVGADGPTHIGAFDLSFLRCIPNMVIMAPSNENECYQMLWTAYRTNKPCAVRYPRGGGTGIAIIESPQLLPIGQGQLVRAGKKIAILAFGSMLDVALIVANEIDASLCNMRFVKPLDIGLIKQMCETHDYIVTIEENVIAGGAGSAISEVMATMNFNLPTLHLGIDDEFPPHGDIKSIIKLCGLDKDSIMESIQQFLV